MKRAGASRDKPTALYLCGKTFWLIYRLGGKKKFHSLGIADYGEAFQKVLEIRQKPELAPTAVFAREIEAFIAHNLARNEYSRRSAGVKVHALKELATATGRANPVQGHRRRCNHVLPTVTGPRGRIYGPKLRRDSAQLLQLAGG